MQRPRIRATVYFLAVFGLGSCGQESAPLPVLRLRLDECRGTLHGPPTPAPGTPLVREEFDAEPQGWTVITDPLNPAAVDPGALQQALGVEGERRFLTLSGRRGALYRTVPLAAGECVLLEGTLRARDVKRDVEPWFGATFWLGEIGSGGAIGKRRTLSSAAQQDGWQTRRSSFRAGAATQNLFLGCVFDMNPKAADGKFHESPGAAVDFERVELTRISERELWELQAAEAVAYAHRGDVLPDDWRARRRVGAMFAAEQRAAILCLPGERLEFELDVPHEQPAFEAGLAPWAPDYRERAGELVFRLRVNGRELLARTLKLGAPLADMGWDDVSCALEEFAGQHVTLELGVEGPLPGLFGAPQVHARGAVAPGWNVVLVSIDTLRADRVGAYGSTSGATPHLDALALESLVFEDMTANAPYTLPAHASLFSGQFPSVHGVETQERLLAPKRSPVLARILAQHGYRTQAFASAGFLIPDFGFHTGFDGFSIVDPLRHPGSDYFREVRETYPTQCFSGFDRTPGVERVQRWIEDHAAEPFFLFVHTYEVHDYDPPPGPLDCVAKGCTSTLTDESSLLLSRKRRPQPFPGTPADRAHVGHLYDAALKHVDAEVGALLDTLARAGLAERTVVIVTSDHGEELFERGYLQHGKTMQREVLRIPLLVKLPGRASTRLVTPAMQVDVAPTLLAALGFASDARFQGHDLLGAKLAPRPLWSEVNDGNAQLEALRDGGWKLIHGSPQAKVNFPSPKEWRLFDLAHDPDELHDLAASAPERLGKLRREFEAYRSLLAEQRAALGAIESSEMDEATRQLLLALGYGGDH
ncbi:MAG: hypothetical protein EXS08_00480 [Planctomycetes bacterium]|nr:hypothetical protein [Planctomycetota bacterium]